MTMPGTVRRALTAADVREIAHAGRRELVVPRGVIVTPLARDTARELGIVLTPEGSPAAAVGPTPVGPDARGGAPDLEAQVRRIVSSLVAAQEPAVSTRPPVRHVDARAITLEPFPYDGPEPGQSVMCGDVVTSAHGSPIAAGFLTLTRGSFPWTLTYDEIEYVIEGELHIGLPSGPVVGRPGDVLYVPKGTAITFGTPSWAKFLYVTFPADWEAGLT